MGCSPGSTILSSVTVDISWTIVTFDVKCECEKNVVFFHENDQTSVAIRPLVHKY